jgi:tetratricopeptide (TPR) repeat protein
LPRLIGTDEVSEAHRQRRRLSVNDDRGCAGGSYGARIGNRGGVSCLAHWRLGLSYAQKGQLHEAEAEIRRANELSGRPPNFLAAHGYVLASLGRKDEAARILQELQSASQKRYVFPNFFTNVYLGLKDNEQALKWLERAYDDRSAAMIGMKVEPMYDPLRGDARFQDLMKRVGFGS